MIKFGKLIIACVLMYVSLFSIAIAAEVEDSAPPRESRCAALEKPHSVTSNGSVVVEHGHIQYEAVAGTLVLDGNGLHEATPAVSMFYVAYFKKGKDAGNRPIVFIYNGGPGSASAGLNIGAWGPKRVIVSEDTHTPPAPYKFVNNEYSLLNVADLVFIDAPATGFSRLIACGKDSGEREREYEKRKEAFFGLDGDAEAFANFIQRFLTKYDRWNSPKYLFGESYGTMRSAVLANYLTNRHQIDLNGVVLLSTAMNVGFQSDPPVPQANPGMFLNYALTLPSYAAIAWYHKVLPKQPPELLPFLKEVESFAVGEYTSALMKGADLPADEERMVAEKLHEYTGLSVSYLLKARLRVDGGMFEHEVLSRQGKTVARLDGRFSGPSMDLLSKGAQYSPAGAAIGSAFASTFNTYVRQTLGFGKGMEYRMSAGKIIGGRWDWVHGRHTIFSGGIAANVAPDLARAMKANPTMKIMVLGGYYDLGTPYLMAEYEMKHLPIPPSLHKNITYHWYRSGHMVQLHVPSLKKMHEDVTQFIQTTSSPDSNVHP